MCGIIGYTGTLDAQSVLLKGLEQLEYRGYDSAGLALETGPEGTASDSPVRLIKHVGRVANLKQLCAGQPVNSHCGIGHTRWATHGGVSNKNAHPHRSGKITLIHNGIIENYHELMVHYNMEQCLHSETDTEVAARVLDIYYERYRDPKQAIFKASTVLKGSYAFCIHFDDIPGKIYCIRNTSPMVATFCRDGAFVASDVTALLSYSRKYFVIPEGMLTVLSPTGIQVLDPEKGSVEPDWMSVTWDVESARKNGYPYFMLKEIHEQPEALLRTLKPRIKDGLPDFSGEEIPDSLLKDCQRISIVACGTAMYAGMVGKSLMEPLLKIPVSVHIASEFRYEHPLVTKDTLVIVISQSGETIDTLAALRLAKEEGAKVLSVVNVKGATIARESDYVLYTHAGPEIAVASTKAYSVQLAALYLLCCQMAYVRGIFDAALARDFTESLFDCIRAIDEVLIKEDEIRNVSDRLTDAKDAYYIGRGLDYAYSLEGALKLKEISYIHAEAYAAGELKHGTIALIEENTPVVAIATQDSIYQKTLSNIREVKARGAFVILITKENTPVPDDLCEIHLTVPVKEDRFTGLPTAVILQLIAYFTSVSKGLDVDKPRNLAKSVTVE